jgi:hypothetical protein
MTKTGTLRVIKATAARWSQQESYPGTWEITLPGGEKIQRTLPLGAAVELEEKGITIVALGPSPSDWEV